MNFRSVADLNNAILNGIASLPTDIDLVVGIPRSGLLAANLLALHLNLPLTDLEGLIEGRVLQTGRRSARKLHSSNAANEFHKILVLDDSLMSGRSMQKARDRLSHVSISGEIIFAAVYVDPGGTELLDFSFEEVRAPRVFEWNFMHSAVTSQACIDIDGVLCIDPSEAQNDDGLLYRQFISEAPPLRVPSVEAGWLVTSRLEKYRRETEEWLQRHSVKYRKLVMLDLPDKASRQACMAHAPFKAKVYKATDSPLFIESSHTQAVEIARLSGKPVLSVERKMIVYPSLLGYAPAYGSKLTRRVRRRVERVNRWIWKYLYRVDPPSVK